MLLLALDVAALILVLCFPQNGRTKLLRTDIFLEFSLALKVSTVEDSS